MKIRTKIKNWLESISDEQIEQFAGKICNFFDKPLIKAFLIVELFCLAQEYNLPFIIEGIFIYILYKIFSFKTNTILNINLNAIKKLITYLENKNNQE